jgi:hypothetical protein
MPIYDETSEGGSVGSGSAEVVAFYSPDLIAAGAIGGGTAFSYQFDLEIQWNTRATIEIDKEFSWNTGILPLKWYRIQGCCVYPTAAGDGIAQATQAGDDGIAQATQAGGCDVIGIQTDDVKCVGALGKQQFIQTLVGTSVSDICNQLTDSKLNWEICSIKQWSRPADNRLVSSDDDCNTLIDVPYSDIPACINLSVKTSSLTKIGVTTYVIEFLFFYISTGGLTTGGNASTGFVGGVESNQSFFEYVSEGGNTLTGGESLVSSSWDNDFLTVMGVTTSIENLEAVFGFSGESSLLELSNQLIGTSCGSCNAMPLIIYLFHNLSNESVLINYMQRNGLELPNPLTMYYSSRSKSWVANFHMTGVSDDNLTSVEKWRFSFEWSCVSSFAGEDIGSNFWKFSMLVVRKNEFSGIDFDTRVLITFPSEQICLNTRNLDFDLSFSLNTLTNFVSNDSDVVPNTTLLKDDIGLFKSKFWARSPNFLIRLSKSTTLTNVQRQDISQIFPRQSNVLSIG